MLLALCTSCPTLERQVDMAELRRRAEGMPGVANVVEIGQACTREGWDAIRREAEASHPNRVLIGACLPYAHVPRLRELGEVTGLSPALMERPTGRVSGAAAAGLWW